MKKVVGFLILICFSCIVWAGFTGENGGNSLGVFNKFNCSTGITCTANRDVFSIVSNPALTGGALTITQTSPSTATTLDIQANNNLSNGDDWQLKSTTSEGGLSFLNNTS